MLALPTHGLQIDFIQSTIKQGADGPIIFFARQPSEGCVATHFIHKAIQNIIGTTAMNVVLGVLFVAPFRNRETFTITLLGDPKW